MLKKNFKVISPRGELSGSEVNDLYKIYTSMDGKHKKFKGSKEEYITAVSELIKKFVDSSMGDSTHLMGGVKLRDILNRNKLKKDIKRLENENKTTSEKLVSTGHETSDSPFWRADIVYNAGDIGLKKALIAETEEGITKRGVNKIKKAKAIIKKEFKEGKKLFEPTKRYTEGTLPEQAETGVYYESDLTHVINPFYISPEGGDVPSFVGSPTEQYKKLVGYTAKYYAFVKTIITSAENTKAGHAPTPVNKTMLRNFLIAAPFQHLTELSPRGRRQREEFASHLTSLGRKTLVGKTKMGWTETEEGSYRSEQFVYWGYLAQSEMNPIKRTCKQFELLGKIFSLETANERVDYNFKLYTGESKGRKTLDGVFLQKGTKRPQIDLDKIISIIAHAATIDSDGKVHYNYPNALFTLYKSDMQLVKYDETEPQAGEVRSRMTEKVPFEVILRLNLLKVIRAARDVKIPALPKAPMIVSGAPSKKELVKQAQDPDYIPKTKRVIKYELEPLPRETYLLTELDELIKDYHTLRKRNEPKLAGKLLSFEKNNAVISKIATALLHNFFIGREFERLEPTLEKNKIALDIVKKEAESFIHQKIKDNKDQQYFKIAPTSVSALKKDFLSPTGLQKYMTEKHKTKDDIFSAGYDQARIKTIISEYVESKITAANLGVTGTMRSLFSAGELYSGKLVDLDISQPYIAKHIEVVGYSKSLFTVNGVLQQPSALNYSKFFVKGEGADRVWLERYQDFTGDTPDNYKFEKIDIEAPIAAYGEFQQIEDITISEKTKLKQDILDNDSKLKIINKIITELGDDRSQEYDSLPSRYEQKKILNFFITKYPIEVQRILDAIDDDITPLEDDGVEEAKGDDDVEETDDDDSKVGEAKPKLKAYHKKVIKYY